MNKLLISAAAVVFASAAFAGDLPSKKAPPAPASVTTSAAASAASTDNTISVDTGYEAATDKYWYGDRSKNTYNITYTRNIGGGFSLGAKAGTSQVYDQGALTQNIEGQVGYKLPTLVGVDLSGKAAVGERFTNGKNFPFYAFYGNADYKINDAIQVNALQYRYRNAFDTANSYESHQLGTGLTYTFADKQSVFGKIYRNYDNAWAGTDNGVTIGYKLAF